jgi:hypothetical protein
VLELHVGLLEQLEVLAERIALQAQLLDASVARSQLCQELRLVRLVVRHLEHGARDAVTVDEPPIYGRRPSAAAVGWSARAGQRC